LAVISNPFLSVNAQSLAHVGRRFLHYVVRRRFGGRPFRNGNMMDAEHAPQRGTVYRYKNTAVYYPRFYIHRTIANKIQIVAVSPVAKYMPVE